MNSKWSRLLVLMLALPVLACAAAEPAVDYAAEEAAIRAIDEQWNQLIREGDAAGIAALYAEDGYIAPPGSDRVQGHEALTGMWTELLSLPELELDIVPGEITVARAGDVAYESGTYTMSFDAGEGRAEDHGKYLVVWTKENGEWKVAADLFNSSVTAE